MTEVVDLGVFADADGVPDMGMMAMHNGRLLVQIRRLANGDPFSFVPPALIAVVDVASEQLIDVDPASPGIQAIQLTGTFPKGKMQVVAESNRLFVSATGMEFDIGGGIEMVDLAAMQSDGLVVPESSGTGSDLGPFVLVSPEEGYLVHTTDIVSSSHLYRFTVADGVDWDDDLHVAVGYFAPVLAHDPQSDTFFFPEGGFGPNGVHVFDALTGTRLTTEPVLTTAPPTDFAVMPGTPMGDMNCMEEFTFDDVEPFVLALIDPAGYQVQYAYCDIGNADMNGDGSVDAADISLFVAVLL